jgi:hypothetical protein
MGVGVLINGFGFGSEGRLRFPSDVLPYQSCPDMGLAIAGLSLPTQLHAYTGVLAVVMGALALALRLPDLVHLKLPERVGAAFRDGHTLAGMGYVFFFVFLVSPERDMDSCRASG